MSFKSDPITNLEAGSVDIINQNIARAYQVKMGSLYVREDSGINNYTFQSMEHGQVSFTATGSPTIARSFGFQEKQNKIVYANAHAISDKCIACVTDITQTGITITVRTVSGTANFSSVVTATNGVSVYFQVVGSNP